MSVRPLTRVAVRFRPAELTPGRPRRFILDHECASSDACRRAVQTSRALAAHAFSVTINFCLVTFRRQAAPPRFQAVVHRDGFVAKVFWQRATHQYGVPSTMRVRCQFDAAGGDGRDRAAR